MEKIELSALDMQAIMQALFDSGDDHAADLHDRLAEYFGRKGQDHDDATATLVVRDPV